jgi:hypothetical protein
MPIKPLLLIAHHPLCEPEKFNQEVQNTEVAYNCHSHTCHAVKFSSRLRRSKSQLFDQLPKTSNLPAILDVGQCDMPIAEEDTALAKPVPTKRYVSPSDVRPYLRLSQDPTSMLPRKNKKSGRSRVLTDTP